MPSDADSFGAHDFVCWLVFLAVMCGWFLFLFAPQRERLTMLQERQDVLSAHCTAEKKELQRLQRSIYALVHGDPGAWERAARGRLGWLEPGEVTDMAAWNQNRMALMPSRAAEVHPEALKPAPALQRPRIPLLPIPPAASARPKLASAERLNTDIVGPSVGSPPAIPMNVEYQRRAAAVKIPKADKRYIR